MVIAGTTYRLLGRDELLLHGPQSPSLPLPAKSEAFVISFNFILLNKVTGVSIPGSMLS